MNDPIIFANKLELYYHFNDNSDYMDATVKHRCEKEILSLIRMLADMLDVRMTIYSEPYPKGAFKEIWGIAGESSRSISIVVNIVIQSLTQELLSPKGQPLSAYDEDKVQRQVAKFRKELKLSPSGGIVSKELLDSINSIPRICKIKSNFYEAIKGYPKVKKITLRALNEKNNSKSGQQEVKREVFDFYILRSDALPSVKDNSATIEIISPVLKDKNYRWKGIYNKGGIVIDFYMCDDDFKKDMYNEKISFTSGMCIDCVLQIERKLGELGDIINVSYTVSTVIRTRFDKLVVVTPQGKRHLQKLKAEKQQLSLDLFG